MQDVLRKRTIARRPLCRKFSPSGVDLLSCNQVCNHVISSPPDNRPSDRGLGGRAALFGRTSRQRIPMNTYSNHGTKSGLDAILHKTWRRTVLTPRARCNSNTLNALASKASYTHVRWLCTNMFDDRGRQSQGRRLLSKR